MHSSCTAADCYGALFRSLTSFELVRECICDSCAHSTLDSQEQCILRVEPDSNTETSILNSFNVAHVQDYRCESCGGRNARQHTRLGDLPRFLVVHMNKYAASDGPTTDVEMRLAGGTMHTTQRTQTSLARIRTTEMRMQTAQAMESLQTK